MKLAELCAEVARRADTAPKGSHVTAADCSRVLAVLFDVLGELPASSAAAVLAKGLESAERRRAKGGE